VSDVTAPAVGGGVEEEADLATNLEWTAIHQGLTMDSGVSIDGTHFAAFQGGTFRIYALQREASDDGSEVAYSFLPVYSRAMEGFSVGCLAAATLVPQMALTGEPPDGSFSGALAAWYDVEQQAYRLQAVSLWVTQREQLAPDGTTTLVQELELDIMPLDTYAPPDDLAGLEPTGMAAAISPNGIFAVNVSARVPDEEQVDVASPYEVLCRQAVLVDRGFRGTGLASFPLPSIEDYDANDYWRVFGGTRPMVRSAFCAHYGREGFNVNHFVLGNGVGQPAYGEGADGGQVVIGRASEQTEVWRLRLFDRFPSLPALAQTIEGYAPQQIATRAAVPRPDDEFAAEDHDLEFARELLIPIGLHSLTPGAPVPGPGELGDMTTSVRLYRTAFRRAIGGVAVVDLEDIGIEVATVSGIANTAPTSLRAAATPVQQVAPDPILLELLEYLDPLLALTFQASMPVPSHRVIVSVSIPDHPRPDDFVGATAFGSYLVHTEVPPEGAVDGQGAEIEAQVVGDKYRILPYGDISALFTVSDTALMVTTSYLQGTRYYDRDDPEGDGLEILEPHPEPEVEPEEA
jgi:hypothetical protein